jgi:hypothetical protein
VTNDLKVSFPQPCSETWDAMRTDGCNRFCDRCEKTIHDLSRLTIDEVEELARSGDICVRAEIGAGGAVKLKGGRHSGRRMFATIGASVGILAASSQAAAAEKPKLGAIKGAVAGSCGVDRITATASDGRVYRAKVGFNGRYKVKRLPAGSYEVKVEPPAAQPPVTEDAGPGEPPPPANGQVMVEPGRTAS